MKNGKVIADEMGVALCECAALYNALADVKAFLAPKRCGVLTVDQMEHLRAVLVSLGGMAARLVKATVPLNGCRIVAKSRRPRPGMN